MSDEAIVMPDKFLDSFVTGFYMDLADIFINIFPKAKIMRSSEFKKNTEHKKIVIFSISHWPPEHLQNLIETNRKTKIVVWHDDMFWVNEKCKNLHHVLLERANLIIHGSRDVYKMIWQKHLHKSFWIPLFPSDCFFLDLKTKPIYRCLLSGKTAPHHYPLRQLILESSHPYVDVFRHPGYNVHDKSCIGVNYAKKIQSYFCSVMDTGKSFATFKYTIQSTPRVFSKSIEEILKSQNRTDIEKFKKLGQVLLKIFEIPASGSLLLCDLDTPEILDMGYQPGVNFVEISGNNFRDLITDCCENPSSYEDIRKNGWILARSHTKEDRKKNVVNILEANNLC